jgi:hypothetical protein
MKAYYPLIVLLICIAHFSCRGQQSETVSTQSESISKIEVVDFHSTHRCKTCNNIEANTRFTLNTYFKTEMENEKITLQVLNVDKDENYPMVEKFQAIGTSLYLNVIKDGTEEQVDLTQFAFKKGNDKEAFCQELKETINSYLKDI